MISHIISVMCLVSAFHSEQQESPWRVILGIGLRITRGMKGTAKDRCPRGLPAATKGNFYIMTLPQAKNASSLNSFPWKCSHFLHIFWLYLSLFKLAWGKNSHVDATSYLIYNKRFSVVFLLETTSVTRKTSTNTSDKEALNSCSLKYRCCHSANVVYSSKIHMLGI